MTIKLNAGPRSVVVQIMDEKAYREFISNKTQDAGQIILVEQSGGGCYPTVIPGTSLCLGAVKDVGSEIDDYTEGDIVILGASASCNVLPISMVGCSGLTIVHVENIYGTVDKT